VSLAQQVKSSLWLIAFYALIMLFSWLGSFGGTGGLVIRGIRCWWR
jgi:predicted Abi (CAAX) family protease